MPGHELTLHRKRDEQWTLQSLADAVHLHPDLVEQFVAYGLLEPVSVEQRLLWFDARAVRRLQSIRRLREDLGINLPGIAAVLDLCERIETLNRELASLRQAQRGS